MFSFTGANTIDSSYKAGPGIPECWTVVHWAITCEVNADATNEATMIASKDFMTGSYVCERTDGLKCVAIMYLHARVDAMT